MPATAQAASPTGFEIDREAHTLRFVRDFDAPRDAVFQAWTRPEEVAEWWDAAGERLSVCEIDLRVGGQFRFVAPHHAHMPFAGTYLEISPPDLLVFQAMDSTGRVALADRNGGTRMTVEIICHSPEHLDHYIQLGVANGTSQTLNNLVDHIAAQG